MNANGVASAVNAIRNELSNGQLVLVLGAGLSAAATKGNPLSMWQGLVNNAIDRCVELGSRDQPWADRAKADAASPYDDDLIAAAEKATSGMGGRTGPNYRRWLRETAGSLHINDTALTDVIKRYASRGSLIATTNYDDIPAEATGWPVVTWRDNTMIQRVYRGDDQAIIHVHGHWNDPVSVVFGSSSYADVLGDQHAAEFLRMMVWGKTAVFCGFGAGLRDPNFTAQLAAQLPGKRICALPTRAQRRSHDSRSRAPARRTHHSGAVRRQTPGPAHISRHHPGQGAIPRRRRHPLAAPAAQSHASRRGDGARQSTRARRTVPDRGAPHRSEKHCGRHVQPADRIVGQGDRPRRSRCLHPLPKPVRRRG